MWRDDNEPEYDLTALEREMRGKKDSWKKKEGVIVEGHISIGLQRSSVRSIQ